VLVTDDRPGGIFDIEAFAAALRTGDRLLAVDVGSKRLGVAMSDVTRTIASSLETIHRTKFVADAERLLALADEHGAGGYVIGLPMNLDGSGSRSAQAAQAFARNLARLTYAPILLWDERLSTVAAERALIEADMSRAKRVEAIDRVAAAIFLQNALDRLAKLRKPPSSE
jgi:putative holliday junction resolvase